MENKKTAVFGIYATSAQAERAVDELVRAGFPSADISALIQDYRGTRDFAPGRHSGRRDDGRYCRRNARHGGEPTPSAILFA